MNILYKIVFTAWCICCISQIASAQNQNALDFDGINDQLVAANASSLITGSTQISIACWVYPRNPAPTFPDFDGIIGFRDNLFTDFYLLQYSANSIEARFTNSSGIQYNIVSQGLQLNTWQHYAMTYDGSYLRVYRNGMITESIAASGSINNSTQPFLVGNQIYQGTNYYLDGKVDEVGLWNRALTDQEIKCLYQNKIDVNSAGLQIYYDFNVGTAGGNNTSIGVIPDRKLQINGSLQGFALNGTGSNLVAGIDNTNNITQVLCSGQTYTFNGQTLTQAGVYTATLTSAANCDSVVKLTIIKNDTSVTQNQNVLTAVQTGATYQWINCITHAPLAGGNNQSFSPTINGSYAVVITANGCSDTSGCRNITVTGLNDLKSAQTLLLPNPAFNSFTIITNQSVTGAEIIISDVSGKMIKQFAASIQQQMQFDISDLNKGVYWVSFKDGKQAAVFKLIKL